MTSRLPGPEHSTSFRTVVFLAFGLLFFLPGNSRAAYLQDASGLVSMETEHFDANVPQGGLEWTEDYSGDYSGSAAMQAPSEGFKTGYVNDSARLDYSVEFAFSGPHYLWVRAYASSSLTNSVHAGLDGGTAAGGANISFTANGTYVWAATTLNIPSAGLHRVNLWVRERFAVVDKVVLTTNAGYVPDGLGPLESTRDADPVDYIATGDSVTVGVGDDDPSDDESQDGRNSGGGFVPILNDLLAADGYPHTFVNEAESGTTSTDGLMALPAILQRNPDAQRVLIMFGMNDARPWLPKPSGLGKWPGDSGYAGTYKDNIQQMLDLIQNDSKEPVLAKVNIALGDSSTGTPYPDPNEGARSVLIQEYNQVVDELFAANTNIEFTPPDFYSYFEINHPTEYFDNVHPNGIGYRSMAQIWNDILTDPAYRRE